MPALRSVAYKYEPAETKLDKPPAPGGVPPRENGEPAIAVSPPVLELIEKPSTASFTKSETYKWPSVLLATMPLLWFGPAMLNGVPKAPVDGLILKAKIWLAMVSTVSKLKYMSSIPRFLFTSSHVNKLGNIF